MRCGLYFYISAEAKERRYPKSIVDGDWAGFGDGYDMTVLLYQACREAGIHADIGHNLPSHGIIIGHSMALRSCTPGSSEGFFVCLQWDWPRATCAQVHLVANRFQEQRTSLTKSERVFSPMHQVFIRHPPQIGLIPRDPARGCRLENLAYIGLQKNLEPLLQTAEFANECQALGVNFIIVNDPKKWSDYSEIDAVLAVRSFKSLIVNKPAQKLYNAWRAGTPAILGPEIGFREERKSEQDYVEASTAEQILDTIRLWKKEPDVFVAMQNRANMRSEDVDSNRILGEWAKFFSSELPQLHERWLGNPVQRKWFFTARLTHFRLRRLRDAIRRY